MLKRFEGRVKRGLNKSRLKREKFFSGGRIKDVLWSRRTRSVLGMRSGRRDLIGRGMRVRWMTQLKAVDFQRGFSRRRGWDVKVFLVIRFRGRSSSVSDSGRDSCNRNTGLLVWKEVGIRIMVRTKGIKWGSVFSTWERVWRGN
jgi:hypothetical protein